MNSITSTEKWNLLCDFDKWLRLLKHYYLRRVDRLTKLSLQVTSAFGNWKQRCLSWIFLRSANTRSVSFQSTTNAYRPRNSDSRMTYELPIAYSSDLQRLHEPDTRKRETIRVLCTTHGRYHRVATLAIFVWLLLTFSSTLTPEIVIWGAVDEVTFEFGQCTISRESRRCSLLEVNNAKQNDSTNWWFVLTSSAIVQFTPIRTTLQENFTHAHTLAP